jgi:hypothetical protein
MPGVSAGVTLWELAVVVGGVDKLSGYLEEKKQTTSGSRVKLVEEER